MKNNLLQTQLQSPAKPTSTAEKTDCQPPIHRDIVDAAYEEDNYPYVAPDGQVWILPVGVFVTLDNWRSHDGADSGGIGSGLLYQAPQKTQK